MANFTDSSQYQVSQYTPQYNLDLYGRVGMQKQQQYDQGVKTVQGYIDNVAGLEVANPVQKQYLQQKLNSTLSQIQGMASSDFSNQSIVNQVTSVAGSIYKDPNIQNAVMSTQKMKQLLTSQKELKDKHPDQYSAQNEDLDNSYVNDYLSNAKVDASFNGPTDATKYIDYHTGLNALLKDVAPNVSYKLGPNGLQYLMDKNSTVTSDTINNAVSGYFGTHPEYLKQLQIDARYEYKDYTSNDLKGGIENFYNKAIGDLQKNNEQYQTYISSAPSDPDGIEHAKNQQAANLKLIDEYSKRRDQSIDGVNDPNMQGQIKTLLFNDRIRTDVVNRYQKDIHDYQANPEKTGENKFMFDSFEHNLSYLKNGLNPQTGAALKPGDEYWDRYLAIKTANTKGANGTGTGVALPNISIQAPDGTTESYNSIEGINNIQTDLTTQIKETKGKLQQQWFNQNGISNPTLKDVDNFNNYASNQEQILASGDGQVDPMYLDFKRITRGQDLQIGSLEKLKNDAIKYAADKNKLPLDQAIITGNGINIGGRNIPLAINPKEHPEFVNEVRDLVNSIGEVDSQNISTSAEGIPVNQSISTEERQRQVSQILDKYKNSPNYSLLQGIANNPNLFNEVKGSIVIPYNSVLEARKVDQNTYLGQHQVNIQPQLQTIGGDTEQSNYYRNRIINNLSEGPNAKTKGNLEGLDLSDIKNKKEIQNIEPTGIFSLAGKTYIRFRFNGKTFDVQDLSTQGSLIPNQDPYEDVTKYVNITGMSPVSGTGVLATDNGKVRFAIGKNQLDGSYTPYIMNGNTPMQIKGTDNQKALSTAGIIQKFEEWSKEINPYTNQPMTRDEILFLVTHDKPSFDKYMKSKITNQ